MSESRATRGSANVRENDGARETGRADKHDDSTTKTKMKRSRRGNCKLNANDCLNLHDMLVCFDGPISREQAWALCHQTARTLSDLPSENLRLLSELSQILLHKDGHIFLDLPKGN